MGRPWARCPHDQVVQPQGGGRQGRDGGADKPANRRIGSNRGACSPLPSARPRVWNAEKLDATSVRGRALPGRPGGAAGERAPCAVGLIGPVSDRRRAPRRAQGQRFWPPNRALGLPRRANRQSSAAANAPCSGMKATAQGGRPRLRRSSRSERRRSPDRRGHGRARRAAQTRGCNPAATGQSGPWAALAANRKEPQQLPWLRGVTTTAPCLAAIFRASRRAQRVL